MALTQAPIRKIFERLTSSARLRLYVWLSLATQVLIVVTGGLVRLTGSGLGCPTWPKCTDDSLISTPEMGIHGLIEFGNRLLTIVLLVVALLTFITILRSHPGERELGRITLIFFGFVSLFVAGLALATISIDLVSSSVLLLATLGILTMAGLFAVVAGKFETKGLAIPSFGLGFGIILQAVVGGISVLTQLNFLIVGLHFLISIVLIAIASLLVFRARPKPAGLISGKARALSVPVAVVSILAIVLGVLVTGAGPHAGDAATPRNGLDLELWQHYHSYPGYLMLVLISLQWFLQITASKSLLGNLASRILTLLLVATLLQAIVGVAQARWGVPPFLVGLHILGAAALSSLITFQFLVLRKAG